MEHHKQRDSPTLISYNPVSTIIYQGNALTIIFIVLTKLQPLPVPSADLPCAGESPGKAGCEVKGGHWSQVSSHRTVIIVPPALPSISNSLSDLAQVWLQHSQPRVVQHSASLSGAGSQGRL